MICGFIISSLLSESPLLSLRYFRNFWKFLLPFFLFFSLKKEDIFPYLRTLGISASVIGVYAIIQHFTGLDLFRSEVLQNQYSPYNGRWHAVGIFSHHLTFGGVFLLICSISTPLIFCVKLPARYRIPLSILSITSFLGVVFSLGRSNWLGIILSMSIIAVFLTGRKILFFFTLSVAILLSGLFFSDNAPKTGFFKKTSLGQRISSISMSSNKDRLMMWKASVNIIVDNPIFGLGPNMGKVMVPYYKKVAETEKHRFQHNPGVGVHNIYLQTWIDFGLVGLAGYLLIWFSLIVTIIKRLISEKIADSVSNSLLLGLLGGFSGSMLAGLFENNFRDGEVQAIILTFMGLALILLQRPEKQTNNL